MKEEEKLGPTGKFPEGKLHDHDKGELVTSLYTEKGKIVMDFGTKLKWVAMTPEQAIGLSGILLKKANEILIGIGKT